MDGWISKNCELHWSQQKHWIDDTVKQGREAAGKPAPSDQMYHSSKGVAVFLVGISKGLQL